MLNTTKDNYKTQRKTAKENESKILKALLPHPKTFTELINELGLSPTGLSKIQSRLVKEELIQKMQYSKAYELTTRGKKAAKAIPLMLDNITEILDEKHSYSNEIGKFSLGYQGISYDLLFDENVNWKLLKLFTDLFRKNSEIIIQQIANIPKILENETELKGKMVMSITIDFDDMKEQFLNRNNKKWQIFGIKWENEEAWLKLFDKGD